MKLSILESKERYESAEKRGKEAEIKLKGRILLLDHAECVVKRTARKPSLELDERDAGAKALDTEGQALALVRLGELLDENLALEESLAKKEASSLKYQSD